MFLFIANAFAQDAAKAAAPNMWASLLPFALIFVIFYFFLIRPQRKRMKEEDALLSSLGVGDEIFTKSGMLGKITGLNDKIVTIEIADNTRVKYLRSQIGGKSKNVLGGPTK